MLGHLTTDWNGRKKQQRIRKTIAEDKQNISFYVEPTPMLLMRLSLKYFATRSISNSPWMGCKEIIFIRERARWGNIHFVKQATISR